jgi:SAGA-associated factor 29
MTDIAPPTRYPRNVNINFRKLDREALSRLSQHYGVYARPDIKHAELANLIAKKFESSVIVAENDVLEKFAAKYCRSGADNPKGSKRARTSREVLDSEPACQGEQVAAKVSRSDENGSWILGNVLDFNGSYYEVQDEDDTTRKMRLAISDVCRLEDSAGHLRRGDNVLAVFPETTSFYRAEVVKNPKAPAHANGQWEVVVRFEDDEDETGKAPPRRVPGRFVLQVGDIDGEIEDN